MNKEECVGGRETLVCRSRERCVGRGRGVWGRPRVDENTLPTINRLHGHTFLMKRKP